MYPIRTHLGFPGCSVIKNLPANTQDSDSIPGSGRCPGEGYGNLLKYSSLGNYRDRVALRATVHGVAKSQAKHRCTHKICIHIHTYLYTYICVCVYIYTHIYI